MKRVLKLIVAVASSHWAKGVLLALWLASLVWMLERGWVWESWEVVLGGVKHRRNYFDINHTSLFVWLTLILLGYIAHRFKTRSLGYYGLTEVLIALVGGFVAVSKLPLTDVSAWLALGASAFVIVRGASNIVEAVAAEETKKGTDNNWELMGDAMSKQSALVDTWKYICDNFSGRLGVARFLFFILNPGAEHTSFLI